MRTWVFGTAALAMCLSLAACSGKNEEAGPVSQAANGGHAVAASAGSGDASGTSPASAHPGRFAALPDRGSLLRYDAQPAERDGAYTWHRTELSEQHALAAIRTGILRVATPDGRLLGFQYDRSVHHDSGDWTWIGHLPGQEGVQAILTFGKGAVYGRIGQPDARPLRLTMRGGASWLVETDPGHLVGIASHAAHPVEPDYQLVSPAALERLRELRASGGVHAAALAPTMASAGASTPTVDLVIGYTNGFVTAKGSQANAITRLNNLIDTANAGLTNSQVNGQIRIVATVQVNYTDLNSNDTALDELTGSDSSGNLNTPPNPAFNALRAAREQYGADLVTLVRPFQDPEQDSCGVAWLIGGGKQTVTATNGWDPYGYSVVSDGTDGRYYCEDHTLAHELGHNMGSAHDRETSKGTDGVLNDPRDYGAFAYSFGYKPLALNFYTIMAYGDAGQDSYLVFSNPRITLCGGNACGVANSEDNAMSIGNILPIVAQFRATVVPVPNNKIRSDFDGDGKSDILWRNNSTGADVIWKSASSATTQAMTAVTNLAWKVAGTGDFDGDGKSDVLWRNNSTGADVIWKSANSATPQAVTSQTDLAWSVAGVGDFDGDGKADILWRNGSTGANAIWKSGNSATTQAINPVATTFKVAGVGDFDGDGKSDVLWRNSNGNNAIWKSGNSSTPQAVTAMSDPAWQVAGTGDFDGDGKSDILWRNGSTGANAIWRSASSATQQSIANAGAAWKAALIADFDGDGKSDILWRNGSTGANTIWKSGSSATLQAVTALSSQAWQVAGA